MIRVVKSCITAMAGCGVAADGVPATMGRKVSVRERRPIRTRYLRTDLSINPNVLQYFPSHITAYDRRPKRFFISNTTLNRIDVFDANRIVESGGQHPCQVWTSPDAYVRYEVPSSERVVLTNMGIPLDEVEDLLLESSAYRQAGRGLLPKLGGVKGQPLTPLHGGHVGLLCTAGMLNGIFGEGQDRHIAHWRSVKFTDHWEEEQEDGTRILHDRERFSHELTLVFANGKTQVLTHEKKESE